MQYSDILSIHSEFLRPKDSSLPLGTLGDGYLLEKNPIYRSVRSLSLELGCKYEQAWPRYLLMPFQELSHIIESQLIPYVPSADLIAAIEVEYPDVFSTADFAAPESHHLHEAVHVIAEFKFKDSFSQQQEELICKMILCESLAMAVDALVWAFANDDMHRYFLQLNSYMQPTSKNILLMKKVVKSIGLKSALVLTVFAYVHANFMLEFSQKTVEQVFAQYLPSTKLSPSLIKDAQEIKKMAEKLDPQFRIQTTQMHLKLNGIQQDILDALNFDFMNHYGQVRDLSKTLNNFFEVPT